MLKIKYGQCACGCGETTKVFQAGEREGEHMPYIKGHQPLSNKQANIDYKWIKDEYKNSKNRSRENPKWNAYQAKRNSPSPF